MELLFTQFWPYVAGAAALVAAFFGMRGVFKSQGKKEEKDARTIAVAKQSTEARDTAAKVEREVDHASADSIVDELESKWVRDPKAGGGN